MTTQSCFLYKIENLINGKAYIGTAFNPEARFKKHRSNKDSNRSLQSAFKKYGMDNFVFQVLFEYSSELDACNAEIMAIDFHNKYCGTYNFTKGGERKGLLEEISLEQLEKLKKLLETGCWMAILIKELNVHGRVIKRWIKENNLPNPSKYKFTKERRDKISKAKKGMIFTEEHKFNLSQARKNYKLTKEQKEKISLSNKGRMVSEQTRLKISLAQKGKEIPEEIKLKISKTLTGRKNKPRSDETKLKISLAQRDLEKEAEIIKYYEEVKNQTKTSKKFNIHPDTVRKILKRNKIK